MIGARAWAGVSVLVALSSGATWMTITFAADTAIPGCVTSEFLYESAPFPECHASTIVETPAGLLAAWFGGTEEKHPDVGIWLSRLVDGKWTTPVEVANGVETESKRHPCWNPVLFQVPGGPLQLYYKVGPSPDTWWGMRMESGDMGQTWSKPQRLTDKALGPIKNKPIMLNDGRMLAGSSTEDQGWRVHVEMTNNLGFSWRLSEPLNDPAVIQAIQPTFLQHGNKKLQMLCRGRGTGKIVEAWSEDNGRSWSALKPMSLPNPNSGIDAVTLSDGTHVVVYNHTVRGRSPLNVAVSDDGVKWYAAAVLESQPGEYSYPAVIQTIDGLIHITYTWKRQRIRHVVLDPKSLPRKEIVDGVWPAD
jgi:predicted neuraminidase